MKRLILSLGLALLLAIAPSVVGASQFDGYVGYSIDDIWYNAGVYQASNSDYNVAGRHSGGVNTYEFYLRWRNVTIPKNSTITAATIVLYFTSSFYGTPKILIQAIDEDDTAVFDSNTNSRDRTTASVEWTIATSPTGQWRTSSDISSVIQEIISRSGWATGNSLAVRGGETATVGQAQFYSWDAGVDGTYAAELHVTYTEPVYGIRSIVVGVP